MTVRFDSQTGSSNLCDLPGMSSALKKQSGHMSSRWEQIKNQ